MSKVSLDRMYELREQIRPLQDELWDLETKEKESSLASLVGKCFKYRNSYGFDEDWWKYAKVLSVKDGLAQAFTFQHTSRDIIEIEVDRGGYFTSGGWQEIAELEFKSAWVVLQRDIAKFAQLAGTDYAAEYDL